MFSQKSHSFTKSWEDPEVRITAAEVMQIRTLSFTVVEPVQAVGVTTTFLQKGTIDHCNLRVLGASALLN